MKAVLMARTGHIVVTWHKVGVVTRHVEASSMMTWSQADVVTAIKAAKSVMRTVSVRHSWAPALVLDVGTLRLLLESEVGTHSIVWLVISLGGGDNV